MIFSILPKNSFDPRQILYILKKIICTFMRRLSSRAFTLMEIMVAIAAIGILLSALLPSLTAYQKRGRDTGRLAHINSIAKMINSYFLDKEDYPDHAA